MHSLDVRLDDATLRAQQACRSAAELLCRSQTSRLAAQAAGDRAHLLLARLHTAGPTSAQL